MDAELREAKYRSLHLTLAIMDAYRDLMSLTAEYNRLYHEEKRRAAALEATVRDLATKNSEASSEPVEPVKDDRSDRDRLYDFLDAAGISYNYWHVGFTVSHEATQEELKNMANRVNIKMLAGNISFDFDRHTGTFMSVGPIS